MDCVMLAAGKSTRMDAWKMMLPWGASTIIETTVEQALAVCSRIILVAGYRADELAALFQGRKEVRVVVNPDFQAGMFASIQCGTALVRSERFFLALGDMPLVDAEIYRALLQYPGEAVIPKYRGKKGHPLLLSEAVRRRIPELAPTDTLRSVLAEFPTLAVPVESKGVLHDIDNPEDYQAHRIG
jgi:molybdenum cofactor cytidylyltransferase